MFMLLHTNVLGVLEHLMHPCVPLQEEDDETDVDADNTEVSGYRYVVPIYPYYVLFDKLEDEMRNYI